VISASIFRIFELLSSKEKKFLLVSYIVLLGLISAPLIYFDFSEALYQFSRSHENQQLDEFMLIAVVAVFLLSIYLIFIASSLGKRLIFAKSEKQDLKRSIEQSRHLVAMGKVLGGVSHSVNNHLLPVIALTEEVLAGLDPHSEAAKDLCVVRDAAIGAAHILTQLKNFSRQEMAVRETCNLGLSLDKAIDLCEKIIPSSIFLYKDLDPCTVQVALSELSLEIVVLNLISNAVDAIGGAAGRIGISLALSDIPAEASDALKAYSTWVSIKIEDSGAGMSSDQLVKIFDPFYTTKSKDKGTGLGLSETYGIIKAGGGYINVESVLGAGATFTIQLPVLLNEERLGHSRFTPL